MTYATIDGFESLTAQEVFDIAAGHLLKQMQRSETGKGCSYRGENGLMCAAGPFLKDEYATKCEGLSWYGLKKDELVPDINLALIGELQMVHDASFPDVWPHKLEALAIRHDLKYKF